jgi:LAO/AO transport system kinase
MWNNMLQKIQEADFKRLARCISLIENEVEGYEKFLMQLPASQTPIIGITGPPGAGKSTITDAIIEQFVQQNKSVAVLCVDPSSPFNLGAVLGDRIRMSQWYSSPKVFIRSLATRGSLGGLHPKIIEITEVLKVSNFDAIIVETVGVGQSEIEIVGLADISVVTLVPEAGDEVQTMKAGLMEIADIFVVNKCDRPEADTFVRHLKAMLAPAFNKTAEVNIIKTVAMRKEGIAELFTAIQEKLSTEKQHQHKKYLLAEKLFSIIRNKRMEAFPKKAILNFIEKHPADNLYQIAAQLLQQKSIS